MIDRRRALPRVLGAVALVAVLAGAVPWALVRVALARFGGPGPWTGVEPPSTWDASTVRAALTTRLSDALVADLLIRVALAVAWVAVTVVVATVVAEVVHQVRHDGIALPSIRGLGWGQPLARYVASGLILVTALFGSARVAAAPVPERVVAVADVATVGELAEVAAVGRFGEVATAAGTPLERVDVGARATSFTGRPAPWAGATSTEHTVEPGDSVYGIAERLAGPDPAAVVAMAEQILDLNLGRQMGDGQRFVNAAYIEPGWVLELPADTRQRAGRVHDDPARHVVARGETLSAIAGQRLGDPDRWPEIFELNVGRTMSDGRRLDDPHLIHPDWELHLPLSAEATPSEPAVPDPPTPPAPDTDDVDTDDVDTDDVDTGTDRAPDADIPDAGTSAAEPSVAVVPDPTDPTVSTDLPDLPDPADAAPSPSVDPGGPELGGDPPDPDDPDAASSLRGVVGPGRAAMLAAGLLTLLAALRARHLRASRPRARLPEARPEMVATERRLRSVDADQRLLRLDLALRAAAATIADRDRQVRVALVATDGAVEVVLTGPCVLPAPWEGDQDRWTLPGHLALDDLAAMGRAVGAPCVALVQLGIAADGRELFVDLESLGVLSIEAPPDDASAVVSAIAATLGSSTFAEVARLVSVGVDPDRFLGHPHVESAASLDEALALAAELIGTTATAHESTFALRARGLGGETWEPAIVLADPPRCGASGVPGSSSWPSPDLPPDLTPDLTVPRGVAVVTTSGDGVHHARLVGSASGWSLTIGLADDPGGSTFALEPVALSHDEAVAVDELLAAAQPDETVAAPVDDDWTLGSPWPLDEGHAGTIDVDESVDECADVPVDERGDEPGPKWTIMVCLLGPVDVVAHDGTVAEFEKSKTRELLAWLATHRERSTRTGARTALWDLDVRDATFANVVSAARRTLARLVVPADGEEWVGRTQTEQLPLHPAVVTDADVVEARLDAARGRPAAQAVELLRPAVELIRGMPFEGTSYLWPDAEGLTSRLVLLATSVTTDLAEHLLALGDVAGVFHATGRGLRVLPGHEELIALRMRAHAASGDHAGIRHEWESYERVITGDPWSDGEPAPKLVALRERLTTAPSG